MFIDLLKTKDLISKVLLCTLNYDMLLEQAIWHKGLKVNYFPESEKLSDVRHVVIPKAWIGKEAMVTLKEEVKKRKRGKGSR